MGAEPTRCDMGECQAPLTQHSPLLSSELVAVTAVVIAAVVMAAVIVFATVFFTGRPDTKPLVGAFATHPRCPLPVAGLLPSWRRCSYRQALRLERLWR